MYHRSGHCTHMVFSLSDWFVRTRRRRRIAGQFFDSGDIW